jgi:hypothetical protein
MWKVTVTHYIRIAKGLADLVDQLNTILELSYTTVACQVLDAGMHTYT